VITQQAERWRTDLIGWALTDGAASPGSCWAAIPRRRSARVPRRMN